MKRLLNFAKVALLASALLIMLSSCSSSEPMKNVSVVSSAKDMLVSFLSFNNDSELSAPEPEGEEFFKNSVFVGDSVTLSLKNYVTNQRNNNNPCLADATFLCSGSMSYYNCTLEIGEKEAVHPKLNGETVLVEDGIKTLGAKKVFIMLGMNDFCLFDFDTDIENAETLINRILKENPDVEIYIQSVSPIISAKEHGKFINENVDEFNKCLEKMCEDNGWTFIDINHVLKDDNNCLNDDYCSDPESQGIHLKQEACEMWVDYLVSSF